MTNEQLLKAIWGQSYEGEPPDRLTVVTVGGVCWLNDGPFQTESSDALDAINSGWDTFKPVVLLFAEGTSRAKLLRLNRVLVLCQDYTGQPGVIVGAKLGRTFDWHEPQRCRLSSFLGFNTAIADVIIPRGWEMSDAMVAKYGIHLLRRLQAKMHPTNEPKKLA